MTELREWSLQGRPEILSGCRTWAAREELRIWGLELALLGYHPPGAVQGPAATGSVYTAQLSLHPDLFEVQTCCQEHDL